jgi:hypothetical protein
LWAKLLGWRRQKAYPFPWVFSFFFSEVKMHFL